MPQTEPAIANYDDHTAEEIRQRLRKLSQADLSKLEAHEKQGQGRRTVLETIAALRGDEPWSGYDDMEVEAVNDALKRRDGDAAGRVLDYERHHKARTTVIEFAKRRRDENDGSSDSAPPAGGKDEPQARTRLQSPKLESQSRRSPGESSSAAPQRTSASRSSDSRSKKSASSSARSKTTSRPGATRSSGSRQTKSSQGGSRPRSQSRSAGRSRTQSGKPSTTRSSQSAGPAIANYDDHTAGEITQRLRSLSQSDLAELEAYEKERQGRRTVLETIAALRGDEPWSGYDDMEVEEVNDALKRRDGDAAGRVLDYERRHKGRKTIIEFASARREASEGSSASTPGSGGKRESQARPRSQSSKSSSRPKGAASKSSSAASRSGSASRSASRSTRGRGAKAPTGRRAKTTLRPSATRSSGSQETRRSRGGSQPRSQSRSASRSRTQSREPAATRSSQSESRAKEALQAAAAKLKQRATEALRNAEAPTKKLAKDTGHAVGSAAQAAPGRLKDRATEALQTAEGPTKKLARDTEEAVGSAAQEGRDALGTAVRDTGQAVAVAANKAKAPALVGAATLATVGGGIALGSKVKQRRRKRVLGVAVPRRTAVGKAAKRVGRAVDSLSSTGQEIGQWSNDLQYVRQRIAGGSGPLDQAAAGGSDRSEMLQSKAAGRKLTPRAVARRILC
jgi:hypothetical protein